MKHTRPTPFLSTSALDVAIKGEHKNPFADLYVNVGKKSQGFGACNFAHLLAEFVTTQCDQVLPQPLHHLDAFCRFG